MSINLFSHIFALPTSPGRLIIFHGGLRHQEIFAGLSALLIALALLRLTIDRGYGKKLAYAGLIVAGIMLCGFQTRIVTANLNGIRFASQFLGNDAGARINSADADLGATAGEIWIDQGAGLTVSTSLTLSANHVMRFIQGGTWVFSNQTLIPSNFDVECAANNATILQASAPLNTPFIKFNGVNHSQIRGCTIDGNAPTNLNTNDLIQFVSSSHIVVDNNHLQNTRGSGIGLVTGNDEIEITNNEIDHTGQALPSSSGACVYSIPNGGATNNNVSLIHNKCHDGNLGIILFPSSTVTNITRGWDVSHNKIWANANDAFQIFSVSIGTNALVQGGKFIGNELWCNGYPANGTNQSPLCVGLGQWRTGTGSSPSGSGADFNSPVMEGWTVAMNESHDNFFEGYDFTPQMAGNVSCTNVANSVCTWQSGDQFNTAWMAGQGIRINGAFFTLLAPPTATSLTLNQNTGLLTNVGYVGMAFARMSISGNVAEHNGFGQPLSSSGQGFSNIGYGDSFVNNVAKNNWSYGMIDQMSFMVSHNGDAAFNNCQGGGACNQGFLCQACLRAQYKDIKTHTNSGSQSVSVYLDPMSTFTVIYSNALCGTTSCGTSTVVDNGGASAFNIVDSGRDRGGAVVAGGPGNLCFNAGGGSGCIDYLGGGGGFTSKMPAANTTLAGLSVPETFLSAQGFNAVTNAIGLQAFNTTTTCTTGASIGATCTTAAITLPIAEADTNYRLSCTGLTPTNVPIVQTVTKSNTTFTITVSALTAAAASFASFDCQVVHN